MNAIETPQDHTADTPASEMVAARPGPSPDVSAPPAVEVPPPRRIQKSFAIAIGVIVVVVVIGLAYWRRRDLDWMFGEFLPYAQITGGLILWIVDLKS